MYTLLLRLLFSFILSFGFSMSAYSLDVVNVTQDIKALDLTDSMDRYINTGDRIQVSTAPGADGIVRRIEVRSQEDISSGNWAVFALSNSSDEQIDRLLVAPHFRLAGSGLIWPDLGASRLVYITPSQGFAPAPQDSADADIYKVTLDPGAVVTFVIEQRTQAIPQLYLWEPDAYRDTLNAHALYKGIVLGIAGLLALLLTVLFVVKRSAMFPAVSGLAWTVLAYLSLEFGFIHQIFQIESGQDQILRAIIEVCLSASLLIFLYAYLNLNRWHVRFSHVAIIWLLALAGLVALAIIEPAVTAGIARLCLGVVGVVGLSVILILALRQFDRAILIIPAWSVLVAWIVFAWSAVSGIFVNDIVSPALAGGLVMVVLLIGFTVMQHAFAGGGLVEGLVSDSERKLLALKGSGDIVWDWDVMRDHMQTTPVIEEVLGLPLGSLKGAALDWIDAMHLDDRDDFKMHLDTMLEQKRGRIDCVFRMRAVDGAYAWFRLRARPIVGDNGEVLRCIGTLIDVTEGKQFEDRLMHDAVYDHLTGLPNRELFVDRLNHALIRARNEKTLRPSIITINLDHFNSVYDKVGTPVADSVLLTVARRVGRLLKQEDSFSRFSSNSFGVILLSEQNPSKIAAFAESVRRALKPPVILGDNEIFLTASLGIVVYDRTMDNAENVIKDAEIAMMQAKRLGGDRAEVYKPALRQYGSDLNAIEADLRKALENDELTVLFQPVVDLTDWSVVGFEALVRWDHPRRGRMSPGEFIPVAEQSGLIIPLGLHVLERSARTLGLWLQNGDVDNDLFVSVNVSSSQLLRHDLINDIKSILTRNDLPPKCLKLEITESLVMDNPEHSAKVLQRIRQLGVKLSLDDFGTGYSSLSYLQRFPFDTIKIDKSFLSVREENKRPVILRTIVTLAHDLGMSVIAEGLESEASVLELQQLGCEMAQGFIFGPPVEANAALEIMQEQSRMVAE